MNTKAQIRRETKKYGTIDEWIAASGMGRTTTYEKLGAGHFRAIKSGKRTLIDFESGFAYLDSLPAAKIRPPPVRSHNPNKKPRPARAPQPEPPRHLRATSETDPVE
jgi:hypothetical protein